MTTTTTLTPRDVAAISCWARTTWRVARSLQAGTPSRPEAEGGTLTHTAAAAFGDHAHYEARHGSGITIYHSTRTGHLQHQRETLHYVTWTTVAAWLNTWTHPDRQTLIQLDSERFHLEHSEEDLTYNPAETTPEAMARAQRRQERMDNGDRAKIRALDQQISALVERYLTGDRSPADQLGFF